MTCTSTESIKKPSKTIANGTFIGSRVIPRELAMPLRKRMGVIARYCAENDIEGWSGAADGMDTWWRLAFRYFGKEELFHQILPWSGFEGFYANEPRQYILDDFMKKFASMTLFDCGVVWLYNLSQGVRNMYLRNVYQVLLPDYSKSDFVAYYAPTTKAGKPKGGTAIAVRVAEALNIPCFNISNEEEFKALCEFLKVNQND